MNNVFISHYGEDEEHLERLKELLKQKGYDARNSSVEKKDYKRNYVVSDALIARYLRRCIRWAGTFIVLIGEDTHTRPWVNYEIQSAAKQGKTIIGIYEWGCKDNVELPEAFNRYGTSLLGWGSIDTLGEIISGEKQPMENFDSTPSAPIHNIIRIRCNS